MNLIFRPVESFIRRTLLRRPIDVANRIPSWLDPRTHSSSKRVRRVHAQNGSLESNHWMLFVYNVTGPVPYCFRRLIETCGRYQINIAVVTNVDLSQGAKTYILDYAQIFIERENIGRDFGAWKDALEILFSRNESINQLILANDSVYYLREEVDGLIRRALACRGFGAITESRQTRHHAQSFFLSFAPEVHKSQAFRQFWKNYLPIHTRDYAIRRGEFALTRSLQQAGFSIEPFYTIDVLIESLSELEDMQLRELIHYLPLKSRSAVQKDVRRGVPPLDAINSEIRKRNPTHVAAFLFLRTSGFPVVKRNLYAKHKYNPGEIEKILRSVDVDSKDDLLSDLRNGWRDCQLN